MNRWERFFRNIQQDLKVYVFMLLLFCLFRAAFIAVLHKYLAAGTPGSQVGLAMYYGARLSLKSAGVITLLTFVFCSLPGLLLSTGRLAKLRLLLGWIYICGLTAAFLASMPYYEQFHVHYSDFIFKTFNEDPAAIFVTLVQEYQFFPRLLAALLLMGILCWLFRKLLHTATLAPPVLCVRWQRMLLQAGVVVLIALFAVFTRFGGSLNYARGISWESAAKCHDEFLNEAILDDVQSLYRAWCINSILQNASRLNISAEHVRQYGDRLAGKHVETADIDGYFRREAQGATMKKPRHIFLFICESYAEWPLLPQYQGLNIANGVKGLLAEREACYVPHFLPTATYTMAGVEGVITGFPEVHLAASHQPESYKAPYATALAWQMKRLGYTTSFWYGGFGSWERIKDFTLAQGFDTFFGGNDFKDRDGNAWGTEDKFFLNNIAQSITDDAPTFSVILTTSNHPPFTVDVKGEGFDADSVKGGLPANLQDDKEVLTKLGHFWYADKVLTDFIREMRSKYPDSLFIITGDHGDRFNLEATPDIYERYAVPLIFYGAGVSANMLPPDAAGSHIDIAPTLIELIAPKGFTYYSLGHSLTRGNKLGINANLWINAGYAGLIDSERTELLPTAVPQVEKADISAVREDADAMRALAWWRIIRGRTIE